MSSEQNVHECDANGMRKELFVGLKIKSNKTTMSKDTPAEEVNKAQEVEAAKRYPLRAEKIYKKIDGWLRDTFIAGAKWQSSLPDAGKEQEAVAFAEWIEEKAYARISSDELKKSVWVNCKENNVLVHGSDYHYTTLVNEVGKTTAELYTLYKQNK